MTYERVQFWGSSMIDRTILAGRGLARILVIALGYSLFLVIILEAGLRLGGAIMILSRNLSDGTVTSPGSEFRILAIGDSSTYGFGVGRESAYPAQLERLLNENGDGRFAVINAGVPGQTSTSILRNIAYQLQKYDPNIVISQMGTNDTNEALNDLSSRVVFGSYVPQFVARMRTYRLACIIRDFIIHTPEIGKDGAWTFFDREQRRDDGGWIHNTFYREQLELNYQDIIDVVQSHGVEVVMISYLRSGPWLRGALKRIAKRNGVIYVDLYSTRTDSSKFFTKDHFHPNERGHRVVAGRILEALSVNQLVH